jgi:hypothetical protein
MTPVSQSESSLRREAGYFHDLFFGGQPDPDIIDRYVAANRLYMPQLDPCSILTLDKILQFQLDAEAVEYALRIRGEGKVLTKKIRILFYLAEVRSGYFSFFFNMEKAPFRAVTGILFSAVLTAAKLIKGMYLIRRHDLV